MALRTLTLRLPFLALDGAKAEEFSPLAAENLALANRLLALPEGERRTRTTAAFPDTALGSAWVNQTIRTVNAATKVRHFTRLPLETNNRNWSLHKGGGTYSSGFGLRRGVKRRVPPEVHAANHAATLDALSAGSAKQGARTPWRSRAGVWYAPLRVTVAVPDERATARCVGSDRGQRHRAVGATPGGRAQCWSCTRIRHGRRQHARWRRKWQAAGKHKTVKRLAGRESRMVGHINHRVSKAIVRFAVEHGGGIRHEGLTGSRTAPQAQASKRDPAKNRGAWSCHDLATKVRYKAAPAGVAVETIAAPYTAQTRNHRGAIGKRDTEPCSCPRRGYRGPADHHAARNSGAWAGAVCHPPLAIADGGPPGPAPNRVRKPAGGQPLAGAQGPESHTL
jgi:putative transposase